MISFARKTTLMQQTPKRINKYISETGFCSRRKVDALIEEQKIKVNGQLAQKGMSVTDNDQIEIDGTLLNNTKPKQVYLAFNKPIGIECTTNQTIKKNIISYINYPERIFPIGRLDKASQGLILLTNDGDIVNQILRSRYHHEKEYIVSVNKKITPSFIKQMKNGVPILGQTTKKCNVFAINENTFKIILTQGLNRQIRRMCTYLNYEVTFLKRVRIMDIKLDVSLGKYRVLKEKEIQTLKNQLNQNQF